MPSLPVLKPWEVSRQRGSHIILTKERHIATLSVPNHPEWLAARCEL